MTHSRPFLWLLLAAALFMRAVLPQGYMPERAADGTIAVALCGSDAVHLIPLAGESDEDSERAEPPCAFAGLAAPAVAPTAFAELSAPALAAAAFAQGFGAPVPAACARLLPPATGPPLAA